MKIYKVNYLLFIAFFTIGITNPELCHGNNPDSIRIGNEEQLFLDDYLIMNSSNIGWHIQPAQKYSGNPVLCPTEPWENKSMSIYGSIIRDNGKYKIWYLTGGAYRGVGYAESKDGINWVKPLLDNVIIEGQRTNLLFRAKGKEKYDGPEEFPSYMELFGVQKDDRDPDPRRKYKMGFLSTISYKGPREDLFHHGQRRGLGVSVSSDGIHWILINPFTTDAIVDGATHWMFDPKRNKYVLYGRTIFTLPEVAQAWSGFDWYKDWHEGRSVARIESDDFIQWDFKDQATAPVVMTADAKDEPGTEIYSMSVFPYESLYIGLIQVFKARPDACFLEIQLAVSHDSYNFIRVGNRKPFIPISPIGSWDRFNISLANNPPIAIDNELRFYYACQQSRHFPYKGKDSGEGGGIGFATMVRGRFVSLEASFDSGSVTTKPLIFDGSKLFLNANCRFGSIKVSLCDDKGNEISDWTNTVTGKDEIAIPVSFGLGDLKKFANQKICFRFVLSNAQLYGFRII
jgi:hypothetical protein